MTAHDDLQALTDPAPFKPHQTLVCRSEIVKRFPDAWDAQVNALGTIWDEVVHHIINEMMGLSLGDADTMHINIREEMALELAPLLFWLSERVIEKRTEGRMFADIDPGAEHDACLGLVAA